ncbi:hypothetical protein DR950_22275 [Kitasatospora xanthocidica]|uniref:LppX_LprAFG lipoprotein n=1 Tax=Kitasatospora xanthocidica TaxID=83382 RepID=A0A372ZWA4_9ACTN|nr:hypothetical protein [Kitasatospora xanthocidica]RGD60153.1 hypothetical protein DR950_22275 [Kitasatospora xanthocidica]
MAGTRKAAVTVVLAALALTATACDNDKSADKNAAPAAPTTAAAPATPSAAAPTGAKPEKVSPAVFLEQVTQKTGAAKSAKVDELIQVGEITMKGQGALSWADGLEADLTMDLSGSPLGKVLAPITGGPKAHYLYTKDAVFLGLGGELLQNSGPRWVRYTTADMAKASGGATDQLQSADPVQGVRTLIAGGKVTEVGPETVNGKATTHYSGVISAADLAIASTQGITQAQADRIKKGLDAAGIASEQVDVWVDADKLVVKRTEQAESKVGAVNVSVSYSDYGTPVIAATPVDYIDLADLQKAAAGS